ncbi:MAG: LUD domain-containing protein [Thermoprotei archaeon]
MNQTREQTTEPHAKTQYGVPIDYNFSKPASETQIQRTAEALRKRGYEVYVVGTPEEARELVKSKLPIDKTIFTGVSETVRLTGIGELIDGQNSPYKSIRKELNKLGSNVSQRERIKMGAVPDIIVGSVHAVTEEGQVLVASASGSQLGPYAATAEKVIWVVGSQKIVPDLNAGLRRLQYYAYPMEDIRARAAYSMPSFLGKILIFNGERPGRITVVLIKSTIGY